MMYFILLGENLKGDDDDANGREREQAEGEERGDDEDWFDVVFHLF